MRDLTSHLYGNPHSQSTSSQLSSDAVNGVRELILRHFNTDSSHYDVIFTSGCTAALKLLAESFPWSASCRTVGSRQTAESDQAVSHQTGVTGQTIVDKRASHKEVDFRINPQATEVLYLSDNSKVTEENKTVEDFPNFPDDGRSIFCYLEDNHTSVVGMREIARHCGARIACTTTRNIKTISTIDPTIEDTCTGISDCQQRPPQFHLFAYPAQSNFSGWKYPLSWSRDLCSGRIRISGLEHISGSWLVVLDAASLVSTSPLDLTSNPAHFVALSFYKMFGYPTGLGALLVRNDCAPLLSKDYYGGGTVLATVSRTGLHVPRAQLHERYSVCVCVQPRIAYS